MTEKIDKERNLRKAFIPTIFEYLLITLPVGYYVAIEALHKHEISYFWQSPEWAIATIFLSFQALRFYVIDLVNSGRKLSVHAIGVFALCFLTIIFISSLNAYLSLDESTTASIVTRIVIFAFTSFAFITMVCAAKLSIINSGGAG